MKLHAYTNGQLVATREVSTAMALDKIKKVIRSRRPAGLSNDALNLAAMQKIGAVHSGQPVEFKQGDHIIKITL